MTRPSRRDDSRSVLVVVGDSFSEGLADAAAPDASDEPTYVGWADRVATALAQLPEDSVAGVPTGSGLRYANLAVRGKLLGEVVADQLTTALAWRPSLLTFHAGGNDVLRPGADVDEVGRRYDLAVRRATLGADRVVLFTVLERSGARGRSAERLAARLARFNAHVRDSADTHGATLVDLARVAALEDRRLWHADRLHLATAGHQRVAAAVLDRLGVPSQPATVGATRGPDDGPDATRAADEWWRTPLPAARASTLGARLADDGAWVVEHLLPWIGRRLRRTSSGDGRGPRRPAPARVDVDATDSWPAATPPAALDASAVT